MANDTAFRAGRFLQGQVTQDFAGCGPGNPPGFGGAAAGPGAAVTGTLQCNPSAVDACPTLRGCQSQPPTALCTQTPELCPTFCGPECQTPQPNCTSINCTQAGPQCPPPTIPPQCPGETNVILDCTFGCTQFGPACPPTPFPQCGTVTADPGCQTVNVQPQAVGAAGQAAITRQTMLVWQCGGPTPATRCFICPPMTFDFNCNFQQRAAAPITPTPASHCFVCDPAFAAGGGEQFAARATAATVCTQSGPQCPSVIDACPTRLCTHAKVCTQFAEQCQSAVDACPTRLCGGGGAAGAAVPGTWPTPATRCFICPPMTLDYNCNVQQAAAAPVAPTPASHCFVCDPAFAAGGGQQLARATAATVCTQSGPQCPSAVDACPTRICTPATVCTQFGCGGGGQTAATVCTQFGHQCQSAVDACPTRLCGQQAVGTWPTPATRCFIC